MLTKAAALVKRRRSKAAFAVLRHIEHMWKNLERHEVQGNESLMGLPHPYIVPGQRFDELYYWDSYFVMIGLAAEGNWQPVEDMVKNFAYLIDTLGHIPNANKNHLLTRSQPPYFAQMIALLARHKGDQVFVEYLPYFLAEYEYWMDGAKKVSAIERAHEKVVRMPDGSLLNRYRDEAAGPRGEEPGNDHVTAGRSESAGKTVFPHIRAACESGWDFSSRWFRDPMDKSTNHTTELVPVDLNCLLYDLEATISKAAALNGNEILSDEFTALADRRRRAINKYCWNKTLGFYDDYDFIAGRHTGRATLAGVYPLAYKVATDHQAKGVVRKLQADFMRSGGLVTTLYESGEQWDSPNGWAPMQYMAIQGLRNYGYNRLASVIKRRWIRANLLIFAKYGKLFEKYDVVRPTRLAGGGEYPLQEGFGWSNGVLEALILE